MFAMSFKKNVSVIGLDINHLSAGKKTDVFYLTQKRIAKKYRFKFFKITTTCTWFYTIKLLNVFVWVTKTHAWSIVLSCLSTLRRLVAKRTT